MAWKIPWMEEAGRLQSLGSLRLGYDWATSLSLCTFMHRRRKWQPTPVFLPGESQGRGAWWAAVFGVAQSRTRLKRLSSSSIDCFPWLYTIHLLEKCFAPVCVCEQLVRRKALCLVPAGRACSAVLLSCVVQSVASKETEPGSLVWKLPAVEQSKKELTEFLSSHQGFTGRNKV